MRGSGTSKGGSFSTQAHKVKGRKLEPWERGHLTEAVAVESAATAQTMPCGGVGGEGGGERGGASLYDLSPCFRLA